MTSLVTQANSSKTLNPAQKAFQRLTLKINILKQALQDRRIELEKGADFHWKNIVPCEKANSESLAELVKARYRLYKNRTDLKARDRKALKEVICLEMSNIYNPAAPIEVDQEIEAIFKELNGVSHSEWLNEESDDMRDQLEDLFKSHGVDIDLSDVNPLEPEQDVMKKVFEAFQKKNGFKEPTIEFEPKPKTKKQIEKQKKIDALKEAQAKGISALYKQLARAIHPDLEQDPIEQVEILKASIDGLNFHPRFYYAQRYNPTLPLSLTLKMHHNELKKTLADRKTLIRQLGSAISLNSLRAEIHSQMADIAFEDLF